MVLPFKLTVPVPVVMAPLLVVCNERVPFTFHVLAEAPVRFNAPALVTAKVPDVVVDSVSGPDATVAVNPPVVGPVIVLAVVPLNVRFPPCVHSPDPVVIAPLLVVCL